jgi:hypothetical protein
MTITPIHVPISNCYLCECGLIGNNAMQCACGNTYGLLCLAAVMDRKSNGVSLENSEAMSGILATPC